MDKLKGLKSYAMLYVLKNNRNSQYFPASFGITSELPFGYYFWIVKENVWNEINFVGKLRKKKTQGLGCKFKVNLRVTQCKYTQLYLLVLMMLYIRQPRNGQQCKCCNKNKKGSRQKMKTHFDMNSHHHEGDLNGNFPSMCQWMNWEDWDFWYDDCIFFTFLFQQTLRI